MQILEKPIALKQLEEESSYEFDEPMIKGVVDVGRELLAVDADMHFELEQLLIADGAKQTDLWGINIFPDKQEWNEILVYDSMVNIRPRQNNRSRSVEDPILRERIMKVVQKWLKK